MLYKLDLSRLVGTIELGFQADALSFWLNHLASNSATIFATHDARDLFSLKRTGFGKLKMAYNN